ncbi:MAG: SDR family oxidoreductase [Chitinophagaceae bacterium]|nr:SDR family oxidoreductase [Oligoflexus sp.]
MHKRSMKHATVVITGATSGIGRAIAMEFAAAKANLVLAARNEDNLRDIVQECIRQGAHAVSVPTDVSELDAMEKLAAMAEAAFEGPIAVWINNAGIGTFGEFSETPLEAHVQVVKTNLIGYMNGCFAVLPYFKKARTGVIINMNSSGAFVPMPFASGYSASKFGLLGFMEALRGELIHDTNIHVCDIYPYFVNTPGFRHAGNYMGVTLKPLPLTIESEVVAQAVFALAQSPRAQTTLGWPTYAARVAYTLFPGLTRSLTGQFLRAYFQTAVPSPQTEGTIFESKREIGRSSGTPSAVAHLPALKPLVSKPMILGAAGLAAVGLGVFLATRSKSRAKLSGKMKSEIDDPSVRTLSENDDYPLYERLQGSQIAKA